MGLLLGSKAPEVFKTTSRLIDNITYARQDVVSWRIGRNCTVQVGVAYQVAKRPTGTVPVLGGTTSQQSQRYVGNTGTQSK
jgi:hypothetical protein